jgi:transposase
MSGIEIVCCPRCGKEVNCAAADIIQQIDVIQARVMLQDVAEREKVIDQWKAMGFIMEERDGLRTGI